MKSEAKENKKEEFEKIIKLYEKYIELITKYPVIGDYRIDTYGFNLCEIYLNTLYIKSDYKKAMQDFITLRKLFENMSDYEYERYIITPVSENIVLLDLKFKLDGMRYNLCIYLPFNMLPSEFKSEHCRIEKTTDNDTTTKYNYICDRQ